MPPHFNSVEAGCIHDWLAGIGFVQAAVETAVAVAVETAAAVAVKTVVVD